MTQATHYIPQGKRSVTPYIVVKGVQRMIDFLVEAFDADAYLTVPNPDGSIGHAEVRVGDCVLMMFDAQADWVETPSFLCLYVPDVDATYAKAIAAGAAEVTPLMTSRMIGDRGARIRDPLGNIWWLQSHLEDVSTDEMMARFSEPAELEKMRIAQESFQTEMRGRSKGAAE
jgi:PhnB protein